MGYGYDYYLWGIEISGGNLENFGMFPGNGGFHTKNREMKIKFYHQSEGK